MGYANYVGRVGALAVALGIGTAVASMPGVAWADPDAGVSSSVDGTAARDAVTSDDDADDAGSVDDAKAADDTGSDEQEDVDADEDDLQDGGNPVDSDIDIDGAEPPESLDLSEDELGVDIGEDDDLEQVEIEVPQPTKRRSGSSQQPVGRSEAQTPSTEGGVAPEAPEAPGESGEVVVGATPAPPPASPPASVPALSNSAAVEQISAPEQPAQKATDSVSVASVLSSVLSPLSSSDGAVPVGSPLAWGLLAFARRQLGQQQETVAGQPQMVVAALVDNTAPTGRVSVGAPGWFTAKVSGRVYGSDADRDQLTYTGPTSTAKGSVVVDQRGRFTYTPNDAARHAAARTGATEADKTDSFVVTLDDGNGGVTPVVVTVRIRPANDRPDSSGSVGLPNMTDGVVSGAISTVDDDQDPLTYRVSETTKGSVVFNPDGTFTYTPTEEAREAAGNRRAWSSVRRESFTVTVDDGHGGTDTVRITVPISAIDNEAPVLDGVDEGNPSFFGGSVSGRVNATDGDGDRLTYAGSASTAKGRVTVYSSGRFTYTPSAAARHAAAATGASEADKTDNFTVTVTDAFGGSLSVPVTIDISPKNAAPSSARARATAPNATTGVVTITVTGRDSDGDTLTFSSPASTPKGTIVNNGNGTFTYTPTVAARRAAGAPGAPAAAKTDALTFTLTDGHGGSRTASVNVGIAPSTANGAPTGGVANPGQPGADGKVSGTVTATDPNGDPLSYAGTGNTTRGSVVVNTTGSFVYTPSDAARHAAAANGAAAALKQDSFTVTVSDGKGGTLAVPVTVTIAPKNTAPVVSSTVGTPNPASGLVTGSVTSTDADADVRTYTAPALSAKGGAVAINSTTGGFTYTPTAAARQAAAAAGATAADKTDTFTVTVNDGHLGGAVTVTLSVAIAPAVNGAPTGGSANPGSPGADGKVSGTVTATDPNGDPLTYSGSGATSKGSVVVNADGTFLYTPSGAARHAAAANGAAAALKQDSFTVTVSDGRGGTLGVPVTVAISPTNSAPVGSFTAGEPNSSNGAVTGAVTSTDADGDVRIYSGPAVSVKGGTLVVNSDGTFTYTPTAALREAAAASGAPASAKVDSFSVTINDGHLNGTTTVNVQVDISPAVVNSASAVGAPAGGVIVGSDGTLYQLAFDITLLDFGGLDSIGPTRVNILAPNGEVRSTIAGIPGYPIHAAVPRADGALLITSADLANVMVHLTLVNPDGTVTPLAVESGKPLLPVPLGSDDTSYTVIVDAESSSTYKVVAVFADGTVTTYAAGTGGGLPVVGPDGTLYAGFADPTNRNYQILVVNPNGTSFVTDSILGQVGLPVLLSADGTAYQVIVTPNATGTAYETTIVTIDGSTVTRRVVAGMPSSQTVAGPDGAIYYLSSGSGGAMTINRVTAGNVTTSGPVVGIPVNVPQIDSNGNAYLLTTNQNTGMAQVSVFTAGGVTSTVQLAGQPVQSNTFGLSSITVGPDGLVYAPIETGSGAYAVVVLSGTGVVDVVPVGGQPNQPVVFSSDGTPYQVIEGFDDQNLVFTTSVVNLSTGATTETIEGAISPTGSVQGGSASPLVFGPDGTGYLLTVRDTGTGFDSTTGLAFDSAGNTVGVFEAVGYVSGVARPNNALGLTVDQFVFGDDGTAYATITNTLGQSTGTVVYAMNASGVSKVAEVENGILGSVTVAPDGTVYLSSGVRDEATGTFTTTVQIITPPTSL